MHCRCIGVANKYLLQLLHDLLEGRLQLLGHSPLHCRQLAQRVVFLHTGLGFNLATWGQHAICCDACNL